MYNLQDCIMYHHRADYGPKPTYHQLEDEVSRSTGGSESGEEKKTGQTQQGYSPSRCGSGFGVEWRGGYDGVSEGEFERLLYATACFPNEYDPIFGEWEISLAEVYEGPPMDPPRWSEFRAEYLSD